MRNSVFIMMLALSACVLSGCAQIEAPNDADTQIVDEASDAKDLHLARSRAMGLSA